jgi:hypothetical protein
MICVVGGVLTASISGCSYGVKYSCAAREAADGKPPATREEALDCAPETYKNAVQQGVPLGRVPCIYVGSRGWSVVVDVTSKRSFRQAVRLCPGFGSASSPHAVVLDRDGNVRFAR